MKIFIDNDNKVKLNGLHFDDEENYINNASVKVQIINNQTDSTIFEQFMSYVSNSDGNYELIIPNDVELETKYYIIKIIANTVDKKATWEESVEAVKRNFNN